MKEGNRHIILAELMEISPFLAEKDPGTAYSVPTGYFDGLPVSIVEKVRDTTALAKGMATSYQLPTGYFEGLSGDILSRIDASGLNSKDIAEELALMAPLLGDLRNKETFAVPTGYFENLRVNRPVSEKTKVVSFRRANRWMQFATAAMVAGILVTGAFIFTDKNDYLGFEKYEQIDMPTALNNVSDEELVSYLENPEHIVSGVVHESGNLSGDDVYGDVRSNIQQLSDEEMDNYLDENPEPSYIISHFKK